MIEAPTQHYSEQALTTAMYTERRHGYSKLTNCVRNLSVRPWQFQLKQ